MLQKWLASTEIPCINGNPIAKQIGGKSEAERFMSGLQAAIASGRIRELLPPEYFQSSETLKTEENTKQLHPFTAYAHLFYAGMRREEMLGLSWEDINFDTGFLRIERVITYPSSKAVVGLPKTKSSSRSVAMPDELIRILKPHRQLSDI